MIKSEVIQSVGILLFILRRRRRRRRRRRMRRNRKRNDVGVKMMLIMMMRRRRRRRRRKRERGIGRGRRAVIQEELTYICSVIEVTIFIFELVIMPSISSFVELTCSFPHVIVDTHAVVIVVTMQLAVLKISNNFSSYSVVYQTLAYEEERSSELQCTSII